MATFSRNIPVHFSDTDPAGILSIRAILK